MTRPDLDRTRIQRLLIDLGNSPDEVATTLRLNGFVGVREEPCHCPIANYLLANGVKDVRVGTDLVEDDLDPLAPDTNRWTVQMPEAAGEFVATFDAGGYSDLAVELDDLPELEEKP